MIEIEKIISTLPLGKLNSYVNTIYKKGLINYYNDNQDLSEIFDIRSLIVKDFKFLILKNEIIEDLKLFSNQYLLDVLNLTHDDLKNTSAKALRLLLISYYDFQYEEDIESALSLEMASSCETPLHDFQERIRRKVVNLIFNGKNRFLIHMPTGAGKTRTATEIIIDFIRFSSSKALLAENYKILWIAQSSELCIQAYETFEFLYNKKGTSPIRIGHYYGKETFTDEIIDSPAIIFCGIQKLLKNYENNIWSKIKKDNYLVIVDEAHRSVATQWKKALDFFVDNNSTFLLGLTATPGSGSIDDISAGYTVAEYYDNNKITLTDEKYQEIDKPIQYLIERDFLANINRIDIQSTVEFRKELEATDDGFVFTGETLDALSINSMRNNSIINIIKNHHEENKKILVFTCGIQHNRILETLLESYGINSEYIDANTKNRNTIIDAFKNGKLNILLNYGVLTTGFDAPRTDVCIIARPIASIVMYSQMVGRILRGPKNKGNKNNILYTIRDNFNHGDYDEMFNSFNEFYN